MKKYIYGRSISEWATAAGISKQAMSEKISRGYDPREILRNANMGTEIVNKMAILNKGPKVEKTGSVGRPKRSEPAVRINVVLDPDAYKAIEALKGKTEIKERSQLICQLVKIAAGLI